MTKPELSEVVDDLLNQMAWIAYKAGQEPTDSPNKANFYEQSEISIKRVKHQLAQAIEQHLVLPEKKKDTTAQDLRAGTFSRGDDRYTDGYNQALTECQQAIDRVVEGLRK